MYSNRGVYLCNAIFVTEIFCYRYSTIENPDKNNIFQQNLAIILLMYLKLSVQNFI